MTHNTQLIQRIKKLRNFIDGNDLDDIVTESSFTNSEFSTKKDKRSQFKVKSIEKLNQTSKKSHHHKVIDHSSKTRHHEKFHNDQYNLYSMKNNRLITKQNQIHSILSNSDEDDDNYTQFSKYSSNFNKIDKYRDINNTSPSHKDRVNKRTTQNGLAKSQFKSKRKYQNSTSSSADEELPNHLQSHQKVKSTTQFIKDFLNESDSSSLSDDFTFNNPMKHTFYNKSFKTRNFDLSTSSDSLLDDFQTYSNHLKNVEPKKSTQMNKRHYLESSSSNEELFDILKNKKHFKYIDSNSDSEEINLTKPTKMYSNYQFFDSSSSSSDDVEIELLKRKVASRPNKRSKFTQFMDSSSDDSIYSILNSKTQKNKDDISTSSEIDIKQLSTLNTKSIMHNKKIYENIMSELSSDSSESIDTKHFNEKSKKIEQKLQLKISQPVEVHSPLKSKKEKMDINFNSDSSEELFNRINKSNKQPKQEVEEISLKNDNSLQDDSMQIEHEILEESIPSQNDISNDHSRTDENGKMNEEIISTKSTEIKNESMDINDVIESESTDSLIKSSNEIDIELENVFKEGEANENEVELSPTIKDIDNRLKSMENEEDIFKIESPFKTNDEGIRIGRSPSNDIQVQDDIPDDLSDEENDKDKKISYSPMFFNYNKMNVDEQQSEIQKKNLNIKPLIIPENENEFETKPGSGLATPIKSPEDKVPGAFNSDNSSDDIFGLTKPSPKSLTPSPFNSDDENDNQNQFTPKKARKTIGLINSSSPTTKKPPPNLPLPSSKPQIQTSFNELDLMEDDDLVINDDDFYELANDQQLNLNEEEIIKETKDLDDIQSNSVSNNGKSDTGIHNLSKNISLDSENSQDSNELSNEDQFNGDDANQEEISTQNENEEILIDDVIDSDLALNSNEQNEIKLNDGVANKETREIDSYEIDKGKLEGLNLFKDISLSSDNSQDFNELSKEDQFIGDDANEEEITTQHDNKEILINDVQNEKIDDVLALNSNEQNEITVDDHTETKETNEFDLYNENNKDIDVENITNQSIEDESIDHQLNFEENDNQLMKDNENVEQLIADDKAIINMENSSDNASLNQIDNIAKEIENLIEEEESDLSSELNIIYEEETDNEEIVQQDELKTSSTNKVDMIINDADLTSNLNETSHKSDSSEEIDFKQNIDIDQIDSNEANDIQQNDIDTVESNEKIDLQQDVIDTVDSNDDNPTQIEQNTELYPDNATLSIPDKKIETNNENVLDLQISDFSSDDELRMQLEQIELNDQDDIDNEEEEESILDILIQNELNVDLKSINDQEAKIEINRNRDSDLENELNQDNNLNANEK